MVFRRGACAHLGGPVEGNEVMRLDAESPDDGVERAPGVTRQEPAPIVASADGQRGPAVVVQGRYSVGRSEPARGRVAMKSSTACSTHRTARLPMRTGFGNLDSPLSA